VETVRAATTGAAAATGAATVGEAANKAMIPFI
jgi:hypothetical protein